MQKPNSNSLFCPHCECPNDYDREYCIICYGKLSDTPISVSQLKEELYKARTEYETKLDDILNKIKRLENAQARSPKKTPIIHPSAPKTQKITTQKYKEATEYRKTQTYTEEKKKLVTETKKSITTENKAFNAPIKTKVDYAPKRSLKEIIKSTPVLSMIFEEINSPIANLIQFVSKHYQQYKEKNQLPVFFMTLAGIGALLFGFGYLMQLSIGYLGELSELVKIGFGFACSFAISFWATKLYAKDDKYKDFSSALISLSVALNYLFIYFLGNMSNSHTILSTSLTGFLLIVCNTGFAIFYALRYQTKIVAVLSLLGGAFAPFYLNSDSSSPVYFAYLWILCIASIYLAKKIKWNSLSVIAFAVSTAIIQTAVFTSINAFTFWVYAIIFHAFAGLFTWYTLFDGKKLVNTLNKATVILLAGNLSVFLFNLFYLFNDYTHFNILGGIYIANALIFFPVIWFFNKEVSRQIKLLLLVISGTFIAFAIPVLFNQHLMGFFWSVEALGLVYLGYLFDLSKVRKEGYFLLCIAIGKIGISITDIWFLNGTNVLISNGYINYLILGLVLGTVVFLLNKFNNKNLNYENKLKGIAFNSLIQWAYLLVLITFAKYSLVWLPFAAVIASAVVIISGYILKFNFSRKLGYFTFVCAIIYSVLVTHFYISSNWSQFLSTVGFANLLGIGVFLFGMHLLHSNKWLTKYISSANINTKEIIKTIENFLSAWFIIAYFITAFNLIGNFAFNLTIIPIFALIFVGYKRKLVATEYLGLFGTITYFICIAISFINTQSLHFSSQPLWGKIALFELLFTMWFLKFYYDKYLIDSKNRKTMDLIREVFYWIVPLLILSPVKRHIPEFIPTAFWISTLLSYVLNKITKRKSLSTEVIILALISACLSCYITDNLYAFTVSYFILGAILYIQKGYDSNILKSSEYRYIIRVVPYYFVATVFISSTKLFDSIIISFILSSVILSNFVLYRRYIAPIQISYVFAFWVAFVFSAISIYGSHFTANTTDNYLSFICLGFNGLILYKKNTVYRDNKFKMWITLIFALHIVFLTGYSLILENSMLTIAFIIHAIIALFNSLRAQYKLMIWLSVSIFATSVIKLYLYDIANFTMLQKVLVFVLIGVLLLGASYLFTKLKDRIS